MGTLTSVLLLIFSFLSGFLSLSDAGCDNVEISRTHHQGIREGLYYRLGSSNTCFGKAMWKQGGYVSQVNYIYYHGSDNGWRGWMVGGAPCGNVGGIAGTDNGGVYDSPDEFTGIWEEAIGDKWQPNPNVKVTCTDGLSLSAQIAIGVMCSLFVVMIIIFVTYRCWKKKDTTPSPQSNASRPDAAMASLPPPTVSNNGEINTAYTSDPGFTLPSYTEAPPSYEEATQGYSQSTYTNPPAPSGGIRGSIPNLEHAVPNVEYAVPDTNQRVPNIQNAVPDVDQAVPDISSSVPNVSSSVPNVDHPSMGNGQYVLIQNNTEQEFTANQRDGSDQPKEQGKDMVVHYDSIEVSVPKPADEEIRERNREEQGDPSAEGVSDNAGPSAPEEDGGDNLSDSRPSDTTHSP